MLGECDDEIGRLSLQVLDLPASMFVEFSVLLPNGTVYQGESCKRTDFTFFNASRVGKLCGKVYNVVSKLHIANVKLDLLSLVRGRDMRQTVPLESHSLKDNPSITLMLCAFDFGLEEEVEVDQTVIQGGEWSKLVADIEFLEARDLPSMDLNGLSDPYLVVTHNGMVYQTPISPATLFVRWTPAQDTTFYLNDKDSMLSIMMYDYDVGKADDFMGGALIDLSKVVRVKSKERLKQKSMWVKLTRRSRTKGFGLEKYSGFLKLRIQVNFDHDSGDQNLLGLFGPACPVLPFRLQVGDVVLFNSTKLSAKVISFLTTSKWDHVGLVVSKPGDPVLYIMEATIQGVHMIELEARLLSFLKEGTSIAVRRLQNVERSPHFYNTLYDFCANHIGKPYENNYLVMIKSQLKSNTKDDLKGLFCSELVAAAYKDLGLFPKEKFASNYTPRDFAGQVDLLKGASLGPKKYYAQATFRQTLKNSATKNDGR